MSLELDQIKTSFEVLHMSPEEIAEDRGLEVVSVKAALMQASALYRKSCNKEEEGEDQTLNFSNDDMRRVNEVIRGIALSSEDDNLRLKAAMYIRDDKKGRKDTVKAVQGMQFNILQFNQSMQAIRSTGDEMKKAILGGGTVNV